MIKERQAAKDKQAKLSVMVVSDYREWEEKSWEEFRRALRALVNQEGIPVEKFMLASHCDSKAGFLCRVRKDLPNEGPVHRC